MCHQVKLFIQFFFCTYSHNTPFNVVISEWSLSCLQRMKYMGVGEGKNKHLNMKGAAPPSGAVVYLHRFFAHFPMSRNSNSQVDSFIECICIGTYVPIKHNYWGVLLTNKYYSTPLPSRSSENWQSLIFHFEEQIYSNYLPQLTQQWRKHVLDM